MADTTEQDSKRQPTWAHCPGCGAHPSLRKGGVFRRHRDKYRFGLREMDRPCPWSGRPPSESDHIGRLRVGQLQARSDAAARELRAREHRRLARVATRLRQRAEAAQAELDAFELRMRKQGDL
jgi:hypothetical protein